LNLQYEVPKATLNFKDYYINMKFAISNIPSDDILGTPLLVAVEPHGSIRLKNGKAGYFITILANNN